MDGNTNVQAVDPEDEDAKMTAELVTEVLIKPIVECACTKSNMRFDELNREMNKLYTILEELSKNERSGFLLKQLQVLIRRESRFAFKRCYIREKGKKVHRFFRIRR